VQAGMSPRTAPRPRAKCAAHVGETAAKRKTVKMMGF